MENDTPGVVGSVPRDGRTAFGAVPDRVVLRNIRETQMSFVTVSRKMGTKGTEVAKQVAKELRYSFYDTADIEEKAEEMGFLDDVRVIDDKAPPPLRRLFSCRPEISLDHLYVVLCELASSGNAVILGRGGNMLFRAFPSALHVRIVASQEKRIQNLGEKGYNREAALTVMEKSDHEREAFLKFAFHRDWENPELYDIVLNMDTITVGRAAGIILHAVRTDEFQAPSGAIAAALEMVELAAKVNMALAQAGLPSSYISASVAEPGKVRLTGIVQVPWERSEAERTAREVQGVKSVENGILIAGL